MFSAYFFGVLTEIFEERKSYLINTAISKVTPSVRIFFEDMILYYK